MKVEQTFENLTEILYIRSMQAVNNDLINAIKQVEHVVQILTEWENDESAFLDVFEKATSKLGISPYEITCQKMLTINPSRFGRHSWN